MSQNDFEAVIKQQMVHPVIEDVVEDNMEEHRELTNMERFVKEVIASINSGEYFKKFGRQIDKDVELAEKSRETNDVISTDSEVKD